MRSVTAAILSFALSVAAPTLSRAQGTADSAREFVQRFYDRFLTALAAGSGALLAVEEDTTVLAPELVDMLKWNQSQFDPMRGQEGLDFDPITNSQDPCEHYIAEAVSRRSHHLFIDVFGVCGGSRTKRPVVIAEVARVRASWVFVDFWYPDDHSDLKSDVRRLQRRSRKPGP
jgi:type II secretory pathway pseudopilin PulG